MKFSTYIHLVMIVIMIEKKRDIFLGAGGGGTISFSALVSPNSISIAVIKFKFGVRVH